MNERLEALRWAAILEHQAKHDGATDYKHKAAAELRRLHQENERLREAVSAEREACAVVCEKLPETFKIAADEFGYKAEAPTAENYAAAIRTRGEA